MSEFNFFSSSSSEEIPGVWNLDWSFWNTPPEYIFFLHVLFYPGRISKSECYIFRGRVHSSSCYSRQNAPILHLQVLEAFFGLSSTHIRIVLEGPGVFPVGGSARCSLFQAFELLAPCSSSSEPPTSSSLRALFACWTKWRPVRLTVQENVYLHVLTEGAWYVILISDFLGILSVSTGENNYVED